MGFFKDLIQFIKAVANDERIPERDKKVVLAMLALVISPFDIIPDWIPVFGLMDDMVLIALILDYFFNVLDQDILLSHYPWGMKSYVRTQRAARTVAFITPSFIKNRIWKYQPSPYSPEKR
jgi:uncharacterized membrane protein YkvA (DUF1232 family)